MKLLGVLLLVISAVLTLVIGYALIETVRRLLS